MICKGQLSSCLLIALLALTQGLHFTSAYSAESRTTYREKHFDLIAKTFISKKSSIKKHRETLMYKIQVNFLFYSRVLCSTYLSETKKKHLMKNSKIKL